MYMYIHTHIYTHICMYIYACIYIYNNNFLRLGELAFLAILSRINNNMYKNDFLTPLTLVQTRMAYEKQVTSKSTPLYLEYLPR